MKTTSATESLRLKTFILSYKSGHGIARGVAQASWKLSPFIAMVSLENNQ